MSTEEENKRLGRDGPPKQTIKNRRTKNLDVETQRKKVVVTKPGAARKADDRGLKGISDAELERRTEALNQAKAREKSEQSSIRISSRQKKRIANYSERKLKDTLLRAALTDFQLDKESGVVVAIPFNDLGKYSSELKEEREDLLSAVRRQVEEVMASAPGRGANINDEKLKEKLLAYKDECERNRPNPRMLYRQGSIIREQLLNPDVRNALNSWDLASLDGFVEDHSSLMRNHFSGSLLRAHEVDDAEISTAKLDEAADSIAALSDLLEKMSEAEGRELFDPELLAILRDNLQDIRDYRSASLNPSISEDQARRLTARFARSVKDGAVFLGRFAFFLTVVLVSTSSMAVFSAVGSLASILGLVEYAKPGTVYWLYGRVKNALPLLPDLPKQKVGTK